MSDARAMTCPGHGGEGGAHGTFPAAGGVSWGGSRVSLAVGGLAPLSPVIGQSQIARLPNEPDCQIGQMSGWGSLPRFGIIGHMVPLRVQKLVVLSEAMTQRKRRTYFWMPCITHQVL